MIPDQQRLPMDQRNARKDKNRQRILQAAMQLLESEGVSGLTMKQIADKAGVAPKTLYNLFETKNGILKALFEDTFSQLRRPSHHAARRSTDEFDLLASMLDTTDSIADLWADPSGRFRLLVSAAKETGTELKTATDIPVRGLTGAMRNLYEAGWIGDEVPPVELAKLIHRANQGTYHQWINAQIDERGVRVCLRFNFLLAILGVAKKNSRARILSELTRKPG